MQFFSPRVRDRILVFLVCLPVWTAIICFLVSFFMPVRKTELIVCGVMAAVASVIYALWVIIKVSRRQIAIRYITNGLILNKYILVDNIFSFRIEWIRNPVFPSGYGNSFLIITTKRMKDFKFPLALYTRNSLLEFANHLKAMGIVES